MTENVLGDEAEELIGRKVVLDTRSNYLYIGTLERVGSNAFVLKDADVHDSRQSNTANELYIIQALQHGIRVNRERVYVLSRDVVSLSALEDVREY
jgi:small nuclear ribonucleoprotein (snRNP)-like protein